MHVISDSVLLRPDPTGVHQLPARASTILVPAAARTRCRIRIGDRALLTADPAADLLIVQSVYTLDAMLSPLHTQLTGGDPS
ncbi:hypothetical protein [Saccharopolyspora gloriosae]|uniref:hypothetical protein n=1 Tax=Saccharopolyspora gloriosae TaxID=455344 RepID=UPI001FB85215|nr:hypothetical protein [Saccharopolyspora gloriosae]